MRNGNKRWLLCVLLASWGCVYPKTKTTRRQVGQRVVDEPRKAGPLVVDARGKGARAVVARVHREGWCQKKIVPIEEVRKETVAEFAGGGGGMPDDPWAAMLFVVVAVPVVVTSGLVTGIVVAASDDEVERRELPAEYTRPRPCPEVQGNVAVELYLPSGSRLTARTNSKGWVRFEIPEGEPEAGTAAAFVGGKQMARFRYGPVGKPITGAEMTQALASVRYELEHCGRTFGVSGSNPMSLVFERGLVKLHQSHGLPAGFAECVDDALGKAKLRPALRYLWRDYPLHFGSAARPVARSEDGCRRYVDEWRAEKDAVAKGRLILAMPDHCRTPKYLR